MVFPAPPASPKPRRSQVLLPHSRCHNPQHVGRRQELQLLLLECPRLVAGENYDDEKNIRPGDALIAGSLGSGDQVTGNVLLVVPADALVVRLKYDTSLLGGDNLYWLYQPGQEQSGATPGATPVIETTPHS